MTGSDEQRPAPREEEFQSMHHLEPGVNYTAPAPRCTVCGSTVENDFLHRPEGPRSGENPYIHAWSPPAAESLPVVTDSARAEAEAAVRFPFSPLGTADVSYRNKVYTQYRHAFITGAEWARAEERKARGE